MHNSNPAYSMIVKSSGYNKSYKLTHNYDNISQKEKSSQNLATHTLKFLMTLGYVFLPMFLTKHSSVKFAE